MQLLVTIDVKIKTKKTANTTTNQIIKGIFFVMG